MTAAGRFCSRRRKQQRQLVVVAHLHRRRQPHHHAFLFFWLFLITTTNCCGLVFCWSLFSCGLSPAASSSIQAASRRSPPPPFASLWFHQHQNQLHPRRTPETTQLRAAASSRESSSTTAPSSSSSSGPSTSSFALRWEGLTVSHDGGDTYQLRDCSYNLQRGTRVALVGRNGAGKSTLLRLLASQCGCESDDGGSLPYFSGTVEVPRDVRVAWVEQEPPSPGDVTVADALLGITTSSSNDNDNDADDNNDSDDDDDIYAVVRRYRRAEQHAHDDHPDAFAQAAAAMDRYSGTWDVLTRADEVASQLRVHHLQSQPLSRLSGGERKRVALAAALVRQPDVLLLDEPTNFLSLAGVAWLTELLKKQQKTNSKLTLLLVTHDRAFLDDVCDFILELDHRGQLVEYPGRYADYLHAKEERMARERAALQSTKQLYKKELEWMRRQPQARQTKAQARIDAFGKLRQAARPQPLSQQGTVDLLSSSSSNNGNRRIGGKILSLRNVNLKFGNDKVILNNFSYDFCKGDRICLSGANGVGKTSFLRVLTGEQSPDSGTVEMGDTIVLGVYDQLGIQIEDPHQSVLDFVLSSVQESSSSSASGGATDMDEARRLLRQFEFPRQRWQQRVSVLSGGERRRLQLLSVISRRPNFLVMDEPSVDLDIPTLQALEAYLQEFQGVLLLVSHDRYFADKVTDHLFIFEGDGEIKDFVGSLSEYGSTLVELENETIGGGEGDTNAIQSAERKASYKEDRDKRNELRNATRRAKKDMDNLEKAIEKLKAKADTIQQEIDNSSDEGWTVLAELTEQFDRTNQDIDEKEMKWIELAELVEETGVEVGG